MKKTKIILSILILITLTATPIEAVHIPDPAPHQELAGEGLEAMESVSPSEIWIQGTFEEEMDTMWVLPGLRELNPDVFGTPETPWGFEEFPLGVPLDIRLTNEAGTEYTTTSIPTPFGDNAAPIEGYVNMTVKDMTLVDNPDSKDEINFYANFTGPDGKLREITVNNAIPVGDDHPFFGGVATGIVQHGYTKIGSRMMPTEYVYVAFWGVGTLTVDGSMVADNRLVHMMLTGNTRNEDYELADSIDEINEEELMVHIMCPPIAVTPDGPTDSPVPTGFTLPNGVEQPFLHINYHNVAVRDLREMSSRAIEQQLDVANSDIESLTDDLDEANQEIQDLEDDLTALTEENTELRNENEELREAGTGYTSTTLIIAVLIGAIVAGAAAYFMAKNQ